eukprot:7383386-Prymnesium_polylepis.2
MERQPGWACAHCTFTNTEEGPTEEVVCSMCGERQPRPAPADPGCAQLLDESLLLNAASLEEEELAKFRRFVSMKTDSHYRECPSCLAPNTKAPSRLSNQLRCTTCSHTFCYVHGDAHPGRGCRQYERTQRKAEAASQAAISEYARRGPNRACRQPIEKAGGCNHMTCSACRTHFCWLCGRQFPESGVNWHFDQMNPLGCGGLHMQGNFRDGLSNRAVVCRIYSHRLLRATVLLPVVAVTAALIAAAAGAGAALYVGYVAMLPVTALLFLCCRKDPRHALDPIFSPLGACSALKNSCADGDALLGPCKAFQVAIGATIGLTLFLLMLAFVLSMFTVALGLAFVGVVFAPALAVVTRKSVKHHLKNAWTPVELVACFVVWLS